MYIWCRLLLNLNATINDNSAQPDRAQLTSSHTVCVQSLTQTRDSVMAQTLTCFFSLLCASALIILTSQFQPNGFCVDKEDGFYADPEKCDHFYRCFHNITVHHECPAGTLFEDSVNACITAANVSCSSNSTHTKRSVRHALTKTLQSQVPAEEREVRSERQTGQQSKIRRVKRASGVLFRQ